VNRVDVETTVKERLEITTEMGDQSRDLLLRMFTGRGGEGNEKKSVTE